MAALVLKKITLLCILLSASLLSTSFAGFAGRKWRFMDKSSFEAAEKTTKETSKKALHYDKATGVHERILRVHTKDYESYDPAPALVKPPFKLIPN